MVEVDKLEGHIWQGQLYVTKENTHLFIQEL